MNDKIKDCIQEGNKALNQKDLDTALNWYERALEFSPTEKEIHEKIIQIYIQKKDRNGYLEAVNRYRSAKDALAAPQQAPPQRFYSAPKSPEPFKLPETPKPIPKSPEPFKLPETPKPISKSPEPFKLPETPKPIPKSPEPFKLPETPKPIPKSPEPFKLPETPKPIPKNKPSEIFLSDSIEAGPPPKTAPEVSDAEMIEADAEQWEKRNEKETASKSYARAASLWKQKGDTTRAGMAYEKSYQLFPDPEVLSKLNELYSQGVKLKQSTIMEIYKKIYHMKM
jgi:tetratricopeptide (TPR) repeat protein